LDAAFNRYQLEQGHSGCIPRSHMWNRSVLQEESITASGHTLEMFTADTRCEEADHGHTGENLPGRYLHQAICNACDWHAIGDENRVVEAWHDHALPGWRQLPILPDDLRGRIGGTTTKNRRAMAWLEENYSADWRQSGSPIRTRRSAPGNRHVPGYLRFGGYGIAVDE